MSGISKYRKIHYSWVVTLGASLVFFLSAGLSGGTFTIFLPGLINVMNLSYSQVSFIPTLSGFVGLFAMFFVRPIINRIGIRRTIFIGGLLITIGTLITATLKSVIILYVGGLIIGLGLGLCSTIPISMLIVRWFDKSIGFAIGLSYAGSGVAVIIGSPIFTYIIMKFGLRAGYIGLAISILTTTILAALLIKDYPKDKGLLPYGFIEDENKVKSRNQDFSDEYLYLETTDKETNRFHLLLVVLVILSIPIKSTVSHMSSILISKGVDSYLAMNMVSIFGLSMVISKMGYGFIMDKLGAYKTIIITFPIWLLTLLLYFVLDKSIILVVLYSFIIGIGPAIGTVPIAVWVSELFSKRNIEKNLTLSQIFLNFGAAIGISILGIFVDITGDYSFGMIFMTGLTLISFGIIIYLYKSNNCRN